MIPVIQTRFGKVGNCFEASIASLLDLKLEEVPDLLAHEHGPWLEKLNNWLSKEYGMAYMEVLLPIKEVELFFSDKDFHHVIIGHTTRSIDIKHAVIGRKGEMVHDPHPSNIGLVKDDTLHIGILVSQCL